MRIFSAFTRSKTEPWKPSEISVTFGNMTALSHRQGRTSYVFFEVLWIYCFSAAFRANSAVGTLSGPRFLLDGRAGNGRNLGLGSRTGNKNRPRARGTRETGDRSFFLLCTFRTYGSASGTVRSRLRASENLSRKHRWPDYDRATIHRWKTGHPVIRFHSWNCTRRLAMHAGPFVWRREIRPSFSRGEREREKDWVASKAVNLLPAREIWGPRVWRDGERPSARGLYSRRT